MKCEECGKRYAYTTVYVKDKAHQVCYECAQKIALYQKCIKKTAPDGATSEAVQGCKKHQAKVSPLVYTCEKGDVKR